MTRVKESILRREHNEQGFGNTKISDCQVLLVSFSFWYPVQLSRNRMLQAFFNFIALCFLAKFL